MYLSTLAAAIFADGSMSPSPMNPSPMGSMNPSPMSSMVGSAMPVDGAMPADGGMSGGMMAMSGPDLLPPLVTWLWLIALAAVLVFHCSHFVRMGGQHRWFHASHILMLVMYASMEFHWKWLPANLQAAVFGLSTAAIVVWMISRFVQRRPFSYLWILALIMQAAMVYMWLPDWLPVLTWALVVYYGLETIARAAFVPLAHPSLTANVSMAIMAASMGYMFAAMQLMR